MKLTDAIDRRKVRIDLSCDRCNERNPEFAGTHVDLNGRVMLIFHCGNCCNDMFLASKYRVIPGYA